MNQPSITGVRHVGLHAPDPERLAAFYQDVLGLQIVAQSKPNVDGVHGSIFLSSPSAEDSYQVALFANPELSHTALQVASLADLRTFHQLLVARGLPIRWTLNHIWIEECLGC
jgi:catechol 2,3-dioxygenase-like lactoylglutathione lyase family enzyme